MLILGKLVQAWRAPQTLSRLEASSSLHPTTILDNLGMCNLQGRQTWSFSSPLDQGGAPGLKSNCAQEASPLQFFDALEEVLPEEQELSQEAPHMDQLRAELASLRIDVEHLVSLIQSDSLNKGDKNILELGTRHGPSQLDECVRERACSDKLVKETCSLDADKKRGEHNRVDFPGQQQQKNKQSNSLQDEEAKQRVACIARSAAYPAKWCKICWKTSHATQACWYKTQQPQQHHKAKAWKQTTRMQQQPAAASEQQLQQQACNNNLGIGEQQPAGSLEQQSLACRSPKQNLGQAWSILIDTGAELSVAPRSFADHIQLSSSEEAPELRTATGKAITTFGIRTVQLLSQGVSFEMSFAIADVEQPLLGVSSLIHAKLSLHIGNLGHHLVNTTGEKIQLEQRGQQIYLVACPIELGLTHCMIGNLLDSSVLPEDKSLVSKVASEEGVPDEGGATSFSLESFEQQQQDRNKTALGTALPKQVVRKLACKNTACKKGTKKKPSAQDASQQHSLRKQKQNCQKGQQEAVGKPRFFEEVELALLTPEDPSSLQEHASKDLSLRILLTLSLMKRWQLTTTRFPAWPPQEELTRQLRSLGLRTSEVDKKIFVGDQLCVMMHENAMMIGGEQLQQECFIDKLSACFPLEATQQLDDRTPLSFLGRTLEYNQAENTMSLHLDPAFYLQLVRRYGLEDAASRSTPRDALRPKAPSRNNKSLDAERTKLYRQTVGQLQWSSLLRPDIGFAVQQLSNSFRKPTAHDEQQLGNLLTYLW